MSRGRLIVIGLIIVAIVGLVFFRGPTPHIAVKPETILNVGPIDLKNTILSTWIVVVIMVALIYIGTRRRDLVPEGVQNAFEAVLEAFYNLVTQVAGERNGRRFFPIVAAIFFFVLFSNWLSLFPVFNVIGLVKEEDSGFVMEQSTVGPLDVGWVNLSSPGELRLTGGDVIDEDDADAEEQAEAARADGKVVGELIPFFRGPNTDVNTPLALAIASAIAVESWGLASLGVGYGKKFFNFGSLFRGVTRLNPSMVFAGIIDAFVGILELISEAVRLISFTFRLFGNMFAGEVVILMFTFLTPVIVTVVFYGLELFVGIIQAFIFAMLTLVFGMMAVSHGGEAHVEEELAHESGAPAPEPQS